MVNSKMRILGCHALVVQVYFSSPALSFVSQSALVARQMPSSIVVSPNNEFQPLHASTETFSDPSVNKPLNSTSLPPPEELPDDVPKDVTKEKLDATLEKEITLYEILEASPMATRVELKKKYVEMAKLSHPDALIGNTNFVQGEAPDFGEIAAAWRILGDTKSRKRYDRELQYKEWSASASKYANEKLEEAVPAVAKIMDNVAVPFLRRTAATTMAVSQAISKIGKVPGSSSESKSSTPSDNIGGSTLTDAFLTAIRAGRNAGRAMDSLEFNEKSEELSDRAQKDQNRAKEIEKELSEVMEKRLLATLQSDELALSSDEAKLVLDRLEANDDPVIDRAQQRTRVDKEIEALRETEQHFIEKLEQYEATDREWNNLLERQEGAKKDLMANKQVEITARKQLEEAIRLVSEAKANLVTTSTALRGVEQKVRKNANEMDRVTFTLSKKQERVRTALRKKADTANGGIQLEYMSEGELAALRRKELQLAGESQQLARMVARLSSRAEKLKSRADALARYQKIEDAGANGSASQWNGAAGQ